MKASFHTEFDTPLDPDAVIASLVDFSSNRPKTWPGLDPEKYRVHELRDTCALVTEGSRHPSVWAREHYDWSTPGKVTWRAEESNFSTPGSGVEVAVSPRPERGTHVTLDWHRDSRGIKGFLVVGVMGLVGRRALASQYKAVFDRLAR